MGGWCYRLTEASGHYSLAERDDATRLQVGDGIGRVAQRRHQFPCPLADPRRVVALRKALAVEFEWQRRCAKGRAARVADLGQAARGLQVRVLEEIPGLGDRRVGQADRFELLLQFRTFPALEDLREPRQ